MSDTTITIKNSENITYSTLESIFAWICFASGYLFCRIFPVYEKPLGGFLFVSALPSPQSHALCADINGFGQHVVCAAGKETVNQNGYR